MPRHDSKACAACRIQELEAELAEAVRLLKAGYLDRLKDEWLDARVAFLAHVEVRT